MRGLLIRVGILAFGLALGTAGVASAQSASAIYSYDAYGRLVQMVSTHPYVNNGQPRTTTYTLDDADNRLQLVVTPDNSGQGGTPSGPSSAWVNNPALWQKIVACAAATPATIANSTCKP